MADQLAYLFECHFKDGTFIQQTQEDVSSVDPTKSAFYDVLQRIDDVLVFGIVNGSHVYVVDLRDGHFIIDDVPFEVNTGKELPTTDCEYRLIYFRRHRHTVTMGYSDVEEHTVDYHLGWQTTIDGENYQRTISVR